MRRRALDYAWGGFGQWWKAIGFSAELEVGANGHAVEIGGLRQRALLAMLLLRANQAVPRDVLVDQLWGGRPPAGAQRTLEVYISRLRKTLEEAAGCQLVGEPGQARPCCGSRTSPVQTWNRFERLAGETSDAFKLSSAAE